MQNHLHLLKSPMIIIHVNLLSFEKRNIERNYEFPNLLPWKINSLLYSFIMQIEMFSYYLLLMVELFVIVFKPLTCNFILFSFRKKEKGKSKYRPDFVFLSFKMIFLLCQWRTVKSMGRV